MSKTITSDFRRYIADLHGAPINSYDNASLYRLSTYLDEIDRKYDKAVTDNYDFLDEVDNLALQEHGLVAFPVDKNEQPWKIGDRFKLFYDSNIYEIDKFVYEDKWYVCFHYVGIDKSVASSYNRLSEEQMALNEHYVESPIDAIKGWITRYEYARLGKDELDELMEIVKRLEEANGNE